MKFLFLKLLSAPFEVKYKNDNPPKFTLDSPNQLDILENSPINTFVGKFVAIDSDGRGQSNVSYTIKESNLFKIDQFTGELYVADNIDRETIPYINLTIIATDSAPFPYQLSSEHQVVITVKDQNDNPPVFPAECLTYLSNDDLKIGVVVMELSTSDLDIGLNAAAQYNVAPDSLLFWKYFKINGSSIILKQTVQFGKLVFI